MLKTGSTVESFNDEDYASDEMQAKAACPVAVKHWYEKNMVDINSNMFVLLVWGAVLFTGQYSAFTEEVTPDTGMLFIDKLSEMFFVSIITGGSLLFSLLVMGGIEDLREGCKKVWERRQERKDAEDSAINHLGDLTAAEESERDPFDDAEDAFRSRAATVLIEHEGKMLDIGAARGCAQALRNQIAGEAKARAEDEAPGKLEQELIHKLNGLISQLSAQQAPVSLNRASFARDEHKQVSQPVNSTKKKMLRAALAGSSHLVRYCSALVSKEKLMSAPVFLLVGASLLCAERVDNGYGVGGAEGDFLKLLTVIPLSYAAGRLAVHGARRTCGFFPVRPAYDLLGDTVAGAVNDGAPGLNSSVRHTLP